jgi:hypothetical protein
MIIEYIYKILNVITDIKSKISQIINNKQDKEENLAISAYINIE